MPEYFDKFPVLPYDINSGADNSGHQELVTDIFFRIAFLEAIKRNQVTYYYHTVQDGETPESLADQLYGNPESHWIILLLNDIQDAQYDWPLDTASFNRYLLDKYGSIAAASQLIHHYEREVRRDINGVAGANTVSTIYTSEIDHADPRLNTDPSFANTYPTIPYDAYNNMPETAFDVIDTSGPTIYITTRRKAISCYEWEHEQNEKKRQIKLLHTDAYSFVLQEFKDLTDRYNPSARYGTKTARL